MSEVRDEDVSEFCRITGGSAERAVALLEACRGNLGLAIEMQLDGVQHPAATDDIALANMAASSERMSPHRLSPSDPVYGSPARVPPRDVVDEDGVRAPIPQRNEVLVPSSPYPMSPTRPSAMYSSFRDFQAETRAQERRLLGQGGGATYGVSTGGSGGGGVADMDVSPGPSGSGGVRTGPVATHVDKRSMLTDLFKPPHDILHKGDMASLKKRGQEENKWLLVNIQNLQEFCCQVLNRDVWNCRKIRDIITKNFILWQAYHESSEGRKFTQFYPVTNWPSVTVLHPMTSEAVGSWNTDKKKEMRRNLEEFCVYHGKPMGEGGTGKGTGQPAEKKPKTVEPEMSIYERDEQAQLEAAIQASLASSSKAPGGGPASRSDEIYTLSSDSDSDCPPLDEDPSIQYADTLDDDDDDDSGDDGDDDRAGGDSDVVCLDQPAKIQGKASSSSPAKKINGSNGAPSTLAKPRWEDFVGNSTDPTVTVRLQFPDQTRKVWSSPNSSLLKALVLYVESMGYPREGFKLLSTYPRRDISGLDMTLTLAQAGMHAQESLVVAPRLSEDEPSLV